MPAAIRSVFGREPESPANANQSPRERSRKSGHSKIGTGDWGPRSTSACQLQPKSPGIPGLFPETADFRK
jgi:hypothetical protein